MQVLNPYHISHVMPFQTAASRATGRKPPEITAVLKPKPQKWMQTGGFSNPQDPSYGYI